MATICNKKRTPLSIDDAKGKFPEGIKIHECSKGICLISGIKHAHECGCCVEGYEAERWWVDLSFVIGDKLNRIRSAHYDFEMDRINDDINEKVFGIKRPFLRAYA